MRPNSDRGSNFKPFLERLFLDADGQHVTFAPHGLDDLRLARLVTQALAQPADLHVDGAVERVGIVPEGEIGKLVA